MHFVDVLVVNAWILYKKNGNPKKDLLEFKASIARALINLGTQKENKRGRPSSGTPPPILKKKKPNHHAPPEIRLGNWGHWPQLIDIKNARRCHSRVCQRKTKYICKRCNEPLCPSCFEYFHTSN